jgi:hypothetical protein
VREFNQLTTSALEPLTFPALLPGQSGTAPAGAIVGGAIVGGAIVGDAKASSHNRSGAGVQILRFSVGALKCLARAGVTQIVNVCHPSAFKSYSQKQQQQQQLQQQQQQQQLDDGEDTAGSRLNRLKGPLSVNTALNSQGGSRDNSPAYTPSVEVQVCVSLDA